MKVIATFGYDRRVRKLLTAAERAAAELEIALAPTAWPVIIYFVISRRGVIYLIDIYAKSEKEDTDRCREA
jgi:hypothetical protein